MLGFTKAQVPSACGDAVFGRQAEAAGRIAVAGTAGVSCLCAKSLVASAAVACCAEALDFAGEGSILAAAGGGRQLYFIAGWGSTVAPAEYRGEGQQADSTQH
jgi:hypothetical protein